MLPPLSKHMLPFLSMYWISTQSYGTALALYTSGELCFQLWRSFLMRLRPLSLAMCSGDSVFRRQSRMQSVFLFFYLSLGPRSIYLNRLHTTHPPLVWSVCSFLRLDHVFHPFIPIPVQSNRRACLHVVWLVSTDAVEGSLDLLESFWSVLLRRYWCRGIDAGVDDGSSAPWSMPAAVMNGCDPASGLVIIGWSVQVVCRGVGAWLRF